jgi:hypothetical protein
MSNQEIIEYLSGVCKLSQDLVTCFDAENIRHFMTFEISEGHRVLVYVLDVADKISKACEIIRIQGGKEFHRMPVIGYDTETAVNRINESLQNTRSNTYYPSKTIPSMIQLALTEHVIVIVRGFKLCRKGNTWDQSLFPDTLKYLLSASNILKVGVAVSRDIGAVESHFGCQVSHNS